VQMVVRVIKKQEPLLQILNFAQYIYPNQNVVRSASYIKWFEKESYMWISGFFPCGKSKENKCSCPRGRNVLPLK
jgi:hypothetical protein